MKPKFLLGLLLASLIPQIVMAQVTFKRDDNSKLMVFEMSPGEELTQSIKIVNFNMEPLDLELFASDSVITATGNSSATSKYEKQSFVGKWVNFTDPIQKLEAEEIRSVNYTIRVPSDATPGTYSGGLSIAPMPKAVVQKATGATTRTRIVTGIYIKVKGEKVTSYALDSFSHKYDNGRHSFSFDLRNDGNTLLQAVGGIEIKNILGESFTAPIGSIGLLKNSKQTTTINWDKTPFWGFFTATAKIKVLELDIITNSYKEVGQLEKTVNFSVIPVTAIIAFLSLLVLLAGTLIIMKKSRKSYLKKCVPYQVAEGETLMSIAKKNKLDWQKVANINGLKAPFELSKGQKILLPPKK